MTEQLAETALPATTRRAFKVQKFVDLVALKTDLSYSLADLTNAMAQQASFFVHYGTLAAQASRQVDDIKMLMEITEAKVYRLVRDELAKAGEKTSEARLDKLVAVDGRMVSLKKALNEAKQIEANAKTAVEGFRHRKDMLVQQGATSREEFKGDLFLSGRRNLEEHNANQRARMLESLTPSDN